MSTAPLDLSAGFEPAAPPPPSAPAAPLDLSAGMMPAGAAQPPPQQGFGARLLDALGNGPALPNGQHATSIDGGMASGLIQGVGKGALSTVAGVAQLAHDGLEHVHKGLGEYGASQASIDAARQLATPTGTAQGVGSGIEGIAEFMLGDGALKGLSMAEKLGKIAPVVQKLEKSPTLLRIAQTAVRQGAVATVQGTAKTGDLGAGSKEGLVAAVTGGAAEGLAAGAGKVAQAFRSIAPTEVTIAGEQVPVLRSQIKEPNGAKPSRLQPDATPQNTPRYAQAQQEAAKKVTRNIAQDALRRSIERTNGTRMTIDPSKMLPAPEGAARPYFDVPTGDAPEPVGDERLLFDPRKRQIGTELVAKPEGTYDPTAPGQAVTKQPRFQFYTGVKPGAGPIDDVVAGPGILRTNDPAAAEQALYHLNTMADEGTLPANMKDAHETLADQVRMHHLQQAGDSHFHVIDPEAAAKGVATFGEAADRLSHIHQPTWDALDQASDWQFGKLRRTEKAALQVIQNGTDTDAIDRAYSKLDDVRDQMDKLFDDHPGVVNEREWVAAKQGYADQMVLRKIHATFEGATNGISAAEEAADPQLLKREIKGLTTRKIETLLQREPRARAVLGDDGVLGAKRMASLLEEPKLAKDASKLSYLINGHIVGHGLRLSAGGLLGAGVQEARGKPIWEGLAAGALLGVGARGVTRAMMVNPAASRNFEYAVRNSVGHKVAVPLLAGMITDAARQQPNTADEPQGGAQQ